MVKEIKRYAFIDRKENKITREDYMAKRIGRAYGFFDCNASKTEIEGELPTIRDLVKTPSELELSLIEGVENLKGDSKLMALTKEAKKFGMKYVLNATCPNATNKKTADELSAILNQAYHSPLYQNKEQFKGEIVYEEKGEYIFRE